MTFGLCHDFVLSLLQSNREDYGLKFGVGGDRPPQEHTTTILLLEKLHQLTTLN